MVYTDNKLSTFNYYLGICFIPDIGFLINSEKKRNDILTGNNWNLSLKQYVMITTLSISTSKGLITCQIQCL